MKLIILRLLFRCIYAAIVSRKSLYYAPWLGGRVFCEVSRVEYIQTMNDYCMRGIISIVKALDPDFGMFHAHRDGKGTKTNPPLHEILGMRKGCPEMH